MKRQKVNVSAILRNVIAILLIVFAAEVGWHGLVDHDLGESLFALFFGVMAVFLSSLTD